MLQHKLKLQELEEAAKAAAQQGQEKQQQLDTLAASHATLQAAHVQASAQAAAQLAASQNESVRLHGALQTAGQLADQQKASMAVVQQQLAGKAQEAAGLQAALAGSKAAADRAREEAQADKADLEQGHRAELASREQAVVHVQAQFGAAVQQLHKAEGDYAALGRKYGKLEAMVLEHEHDLERTAAELDEKSEPCLSGSSRLALVPGAKHEACRRRDLQTHCAAPGWTACQACQDGKVHVRLPILCTFTAINRMVWLHVLVVSAACRYHLLGLWCALCCVMLAISCGRSITLAVLLQTASWPRSAMQRSPQCPCP